MGVVRDSENLSEIEKKGMTQIREGILTKGWHLYQTDKSGRMCLDTVTNYVKCMEEHVQKDQIVTAARVRKAENILNNFSRTWVKMCDIGGRNNHGWRSNRALISNYSTIPPLMGLRKDHKDNINNDAVLGPKLRPLYPAMLP